MCDDTAGRTIHIDQIDPGTRRRAFGDGLTAADRLRASISPHFPPQTVDRMVADMLAKMEARVAAGEMIPIVGPPGVMGWYPDSEAVRILTRTPAERAADLQRGEEMAKAMWAAREGSPGKDRR